MYLGQSLLINIRHFYLLSGDVIGAKQKNQREYMEMEFVNYFLAEHGVSNNSRRRALGKFHCNIIIAANRGDKK